MLITRRIYGLLLLLPLLVAAPGYAALVDCAALFAKTGSDRLKINPNDMQQCRDRGASPPANWRQDGGRSGGVSSAGAGSSTLNVVQGPERSPGAVGAPYSVSASTLNFALSFPPWSGFPCQLPGGIDVCGSGDGSGTGTGTGTGAGTAASGGAFCPQETDNTGTFGRTYALSGGQSALVCGGAVPLTSYQLSLTRNATHLASTEYGAYFLWVYQQSGSNFAPIAGSPLRLPTYLCMPTGNNGSMVRSVNLPPPAAQMITYNSSTGSLSIRLKELDLSQNPNQINYDGPERYLLIPLQGGVPQVPADCARETDYYRTVPMPAVDMAFDGTITPVCEEGQFCNAATATAPAGGACDTATSYPQGTVNTSAGPINCTGKVQVTVLSRPNLVFPPGTTPTSTPITGRTGLLVNSMDGSGLFLSRDASIRLSTSAPAMVLPSGGTVDMADGGKLLMTSPATVNPSSGQITLTGGGELLSATGSSQQTFPAGSRIAPNILLPMTVHVEREINLPAGYAIPTQPNPYVRLPVVTQ